MFTNSITCSSDAAQRRQPLSNVCSGTGFLADRTAAHSMIGYCHDTVVCLSVHLSMANSIGVRSAISQQQLGFFFVKFGITQIRTTRYKAKTKASLCKSWAERPRSSPPSQSLHVTPYVALEVELESPQLGFCIMTTFQRGVALSHHFTTFLNV